MKKVSGSDATDINVGSITGKEQEAMLGTMEQRTEGMKKQAQELIEQAYRAGYDNAKGNIISDTESIVEELMEIGRYEAWDAADKLNRMRIDDIKELFADDPLCESIAREALFSCCTPELAIEKLKTYEDRKKHEEDSEIRIGDEVILNLNSSFEPNTKAIIIMNDNSARYPYNVMVDNGDTEWVDRDTIDRKTGRHFHEIENVLGKLKEGNNG